MLYLPFLNYYSTTDHIDINVPDDSEIVYDMSKDRIGDAIGALSILEHATKINPKLKMSVLYSAREYEEYSWINGIDLFAWSEWKPYKVYRDSVPKSAFLVDSASGCSLSIWNTLSKLKLSPKLRSPVKVDTPHNEFSVSMHIINAVGVRNQPYVSRRALSMEKYESLGKYLSGNGITVTRLGAEYDRVRDFDSCINDLTSKNLTLHDTFLSLAKSNLFMGGDSGLTHAAAALGIPVITEIDAVSKGALGLAGIPQNLLTEIPYNCNFETHLQLLQNHPLLKDRATI